jgi:hypothetical protein
MTYLSHVSRAERNQHVARDEGLFQPVEDRRHCVDGPHFPTLLPHALGQMSGRHAVSDAGRFAGGEDLGHGQLIGILQTRREFVQEVPRPRHLMGLKNAA